MKRSQVSNRLTGLSIWLSHDHAIEPTDAPVPRACPLLFFSFRVEIVPLHDTKSFQGRENVLKVANTFRHEIETWAED